jgi:hypothetical protein
MRYRTTIGSALTYRCAKTHHCSDARKRSAISCRFRFWADCIINMFESRFFGEDNSEGYKTRSFRAVDLMLEATQRQGRYREVMHRPPPVA